MPLFQDSSSGAGTLPPLNLSNFTANGSIGTAAATVDTNINQITLNQTTANVTLTVPAATSSTDYKVVDFQNIGTVACTLAFSGGSTSVIPSKGTIRAAWNGTNWSIVNNAAITLDAGSSDVGSADISVTAGNIATTSSVLALTINIPSAGTWEIDTCLAFNQAALTTNQNSELLQGLFLASAPTVVLNNTTKTVYRLASGNAGTSFVSSTQASHTYQVTTTGAAIYQIRVWTPNARFGVIEGTSIQGSAGFNGCSWKKIAGGVSIGGIVGAVSGEIKYLNRTTDLGDWIFLDGRATSSLSTAQQAISTSLGYGANIPDMRGRLPIGVSGSLPLNSSGGSSTFAQNNLPNVQIAVTGTVNVTTWNYNGTTGNARMPSGGQTFDANVTGSPSISGSTNSINGGVAQQPFLPPYIALGNYFVWLGGNASTTTMLPLSLTTTGSGVATFNGSTSILNIPTAATTPIMIGATGSLAGIAGTVPAPAIAERIRPLLGSGKFTPAANEGIDIITGTTGVLNLDSGNTGDVNVGTGSASKFVTIGSNNTGSTLNLQSGTGGSRLESSGSGQVNIATNVSTGTVSIGSGSQGAVNLGTGATAKTITIGNATGGTTLQLLSGTGSVSMNAAGTGGINVGTSASTGTVNIGTGATLNVDVGGGGTTKAVYLGCAFGASSTLIQSGTGSTTIQSTSTGQIAIGTNGSTGVISIGNAGGIKNIAIGQQTVAQSLLLEGGSGINIFNGLNTQPINIRSNQTTVNIQEQAGSLVLGNLAGAAITTIQAGTGGVSMNTIGTGAVDIGNNASTGAISIGVGSQATVNVGTGAVQKNITIGNLSGSSSTTIQANNGGISINSGTAGNINIGNNGGTGAVNISTSGDRTLTLGNSVGASGMNILTGTSPIGINTNGGAINIGNAGTAGAVNIGSAGARNIIIGSPTALGLTIRSSVGVSIGGTQLAPTADNATSLGTAGARWTTVFAANGVISTSDRTLKRDIKPLIGAGELIDQLKTYSFKLNGDDRVKSGLMAQDVLKIAPEKVWGSKDGEYGIDYSSFVAELIACVQDLRARVAELEDF